MAVSDASFRATSAAHECGGEWRFRESGTYSLDPDQQNGFSDLPADHCWVDGIHATNQDGARNRDAMFLANYSRATNKILFGFGFGFGFGIHVSPAGGVPRLHNQRQPRARRARRGRRAGRPEPEGEDYGDGIMCWGAGVTITGNVVTCRGGANARIGIHVEGLGDQARQSCVHANSMATITGNVVHGQF